MAYNDRIKEARLAKGLTQKQLANIVGIGATTVTGYEKGNSEPSMFVLNEIMKTLGVDANYIFQDEMSCFGHSPSQLKDNEMKIIEKYRRLDSHGKDLIDAILDMETSRVKVESEGIDKIVELISGDEKVILRADEVKAALNDPSYAVALKYVKKQREQEIERVFNEAKKLEKKTSTR